MITSNSYRVTKQTVLYNVTSLKQKMKWGYEMTGSEEKIRKDGHQRKYKKRSIPVTHLYYWLDSRDLNPGPGDYESVLSCLYRLILTYTVCYCLYNIRLLKVKPVLLSDTEYQAEIRLIDTYMDT